MPVSPLVAIAMLLSLVAIVAGFLLLVWGADRFIAGAASVARIFGVSPLVIGLTIVALGTSAPEIVVSVTASLVGNPGLAIGNAIGSNIANIGLVLGVSALIAPMQVHSKTLRREIPILLVVVLATYALMLDGYLSRADGGILLAGLIIVVVWITRLGLGSSQADPLPGELAEEVPPAMGSGRSILWLVVGMVVLPLSSRLLVWGAINVATTLGISDLVIGLTIVAVGTSLPELAASLMGALKGEHDLAIGNVIGSNMWNLLAVLSVPGLLRPSSLDPLVLTRDFPVMIGMTVAVAVMSYGFRGHGQINRLEALLLLVAFSTYLVYLYLSSAA